MTAIVGLVHTDGSVWLGGDSAGSNSTTVWVRSDEKVFTQGEFVIGFTGSFRARDVLRYQMTMAQPKPTDDIDRFMRTAFVEDIRGAYNRAGYMARDDGKDGVNSRLLVGVRGRLFMVDSDFAVGSFVTEFGCVGSGYAEAQGSLYSTRDWTDPQKRLNEALNAATYWNPGVRPPFSFVRTLPWPPQR